MKSIINQNSDIYYKGNYWNDLPKVLEYMSQNFTGNKDKYWVDDFKERFAKKPFKHGLFLNCGNGWVERDFIDKNIVLEATAFDYAKELLKIAKEKKGNRKIKYFQADVNKVDFKENQFDLIVNVAALHHVQYINRLSFVLAKCLKKYGIFVNFDYIGPHRNQYPLKQWYYINKINNSLPDNIKKSPLDYPHLATMLHHDPTEAIHSELIFESLSYFFDIFERHDTGGGIAYMILTHNTKLNKIRQKILDKYINKILTADKYYTDSGKVPSMFSYFIAKSKKEVLLDKHRVKFIKDRENLREKNAESLAGVYTKYDFLKLIYHYLKRITYGNNQARIIFLKQGIFFVSRRLKMHFIHRIKNLLY